MGYTTDFEGHMELKQIEVKNTDGKGVNLNLTIEEVMTLVNGLAKTRRMCRDLSKISDENGMLNGVHYSEYGVEGEFYYNKDSECSGQDKDNSILDENKESKSQHGLWSHWTIGFYRAGMFLKEESYILEWDGGEKFYAYTEWLDYLNENIFKPNNIVMDGEIQWRGEDNEDMGKIISKDGVIKVYKAEINWKERD